MKNINEIIQDQKELFGGLKDKEEKKQEKTDDKLWVLRLFSSTLKALREHNWSVIVKNDDKEELKSIERAISALPQPKDTVNVSNMVDYTKKLNELITKVESLKLQVNIPETKIPDTVKVSNLKDIKIPEVKIPEFPKIPEPKDVDFSKLINELQAIKKAVEVVGVGNDEKIQKSLTSVLGDLKSGLLKLEQTVKDSKVEIPDNTKDIIEGYKKVVKSIQDIKFPVPNFQSSWQHSLTMQAEDLPKTYIYTIVGGTKVVDYIEMSTPSGDTYRKTFDYTSVDPNNPDGHSGWVKQ